jgi:hypothetical protein
MRILSLGLILSCVACSSAPSKPVANTSNGTEAAKVEVSTASNPVSADSSSEKIGVESIAEVMTAPSAVPAPMDQADMATEVKAAFTQNQKLSPEQSAAMSTTSLALIEAANAGDQAAVQGLSNQLLKQAVAAQAFGGFGLVDPAAIVQAIMDLIAAAVNADVAGVVDAIMDLIAAIGA